MRCRKTGIRSDRERTAGRTEQRDRQESLTTKAERQIREERERSERKAGGEGDRSEATKVERWSQRERQTGKEVEGQTGGLTNDRERQKSPKIDRGFKRQTGS